MFHTFASPVITPSGQSCLAATPPTRKRVFPRFNSESPSTPTRALFHKKPAKSSTEQRSDRGNKLSEPVEKWQRSAMKKVSAKGLLNFAGDFRRWLGGKKFDGKFSTMKMRLARMTQFP
jgi:hypothetical protein